jgi:hypothetical protein
LGRGDGALKESALCGKGIDVRAGLARVTIARETIRPQGVQNDKYDIRSGLCFLHLLISDPPEKYPPFAQEPQRALPEAYA